MPSSPDLLEKPGSTLYLVSPSYRGGASEKGIIDQAAWTVPPTERKVSSISSGGQENVSADQSTSLTGAELQPRSMDEARLIVRGLPGSLVRLVDYTHMIDRAAA